MIGVLTASLGGFPVKHTGGATDKFYLEKRIRTFVYLSSAKLEPLYHQIKEPIRKRIALTLGVGVPGLPVAPKAEAQISPPSKNEADMLAVVLAHLDEAGDIGTIDEPLGYFSGRLMLRWSAAEEFLFLSGSTAHTLLALTGSNRHLVGHFEPTLGNVSLPGSSRVDTYRTLDEIFADAEEYSEGDPTSSRNSRFPAAPLVRGGAGCANHSSSSHADSLTTMVTSQRTGRSVPTSNT